MTTAVGYRPQRMQVSWRAVECCVVGVLLLFHTGAVTVLFFTDPTAVAQRTLQLLLLPVYLITMLVAARHPRQLLSALRGNLLFALLVALPFLSTLWSVSPSITLRRAIGLALSVLLAYVVATRFTPRQFLLIVVAVLGTSMVCSLLLAVLAPQMAYMPVGHELRGVFNHKNVLGWNAAICVLATANLAVDRTANLRGLATILLIASFCCLVLSGSSTALVVSAASGFFTLVYILLRQSRGATRIVLILIAAQVVLVASVSINLLVELLAEGVDKDPSLTGRVPLWSLVDQNIMRRPLLGHGYQAFWTEGNGEAWNIWTELAWIAPHAHNGFRDWMLSCGIIGTIPLLAMLWRVLSRGAWLHWHRPQEGWLWLNVLICVFIVMNLTESLLLVQNSFLFIIFSAAVLMVSAGRPRA
ncbi:O-antigen ligase family protein [Paracoccus rhizosphaerae]|uniref:O-antigen ligase family protein n=1 Tax=Paracoccus rhizosphaerae TaxID=1133347 RepID=A0ABV6CMK1_9RHOB|nr:O-antigen ligase family protein [Paracoccus rhizosphaerae]